MNKIVSNIHSFIIFYGLWAAFEQYNQVNDLILNKNGEYAASVNKVRNAKRKLLKIKKIKRELKKSQDEFRNIEKILKIAQEKLPANFDESKDFNYFKKIGKKIKIKDMFLSIGQIENKGYYKVNDLNVKLRNITYLQLLIFLENLSHSKKLYNMDKLTIENNKMNSRGRYQLISAVIQVQTYRSNILNK